MDRETLETRLSAEVQELDLEEFVLQLEVDGLCVVPPKKTGVGTDTISAVSYTHLRAHET